MIIGYAGASTTEQYLELQRNAGNRNRSCRDDIWQVKIGE